jgi:hypothetical protein
MEVCRFHRQYVHATTREQFTAVSLVKDVMMQASVIEVVERSAAKLLWGARKWIQTEVMFLQDLWQVSQIVFLSALLEILKHVVDAGRRSAVIEGLGMVWKN